MRAGGGRERRLRRHSFLPMKCRRKSMGSGKMMVEFFSAEMVLSVCRREGGREGGGRKEMVSRGVST